MSLRNCEEGMDYSWVKEEMYDCRVSAEQKLGAIVHPNYAEELSRILCTAWNCGDADAIFIAEHLNICRKEFLAIERDEELFMRIQLEEMFP